MARSVMLYVLLAIYMISCALEMALLSDMVYWLHYRAGKAFEIAYQGSSFSLHGKPLNVLTDQGHVSNAAAGTGFVLVGLGGILALWLRNKRDSHALHRAWLVFTVLSVLLTVVALAYTFVLTISHEDQTISVALASTLHNEPYPNYVAYPNDIWTPENWLTAVLQLRLISNTDQNDIQLHLTLMKIWRWNLIPMLALSMAVSSLAFIDALRHRRSGKDSRGSYELATGKRVLR